MSTENDLWKSIVDGLKEKPAYLLIFGITALLTISGGLGSVLSASVGDDFKFSLCIGLMGLSLVIAYLTVNKVESSPDVKGRREYGKLMRRISSIHPKGPQKLQQFRQAIRLVVETDVRYGGLSLGLRIKDPVHAVPMLHRLVGDISELERMSNIMASFITLATKEHNLSFEKIVFPKSGNAIFSIKTAEKTGYAYVGFRGRDFGITAVDGIPIEENYFDGYLSKGDKVILVDDITFRGDTVKETISFLEEASVKVEGVFVLAAHSEHAQDLQQILEREHGGVKFLPILEL